MPGFPEIQAGGVPGGLLNLHRAAWQVRGAAMAGAAAEEP